MGCAQHECHCAGHEAPEPQSERAQSRRLPRRAQLLAEDAHLAPALIPAPRRAAPLPPASLVLRTIAA
ncbi:hypothetical protein Y1Q_0019742 [Alligator mississippiensis]|uniref:Uncharacterized protein n=1 Tax=Alligator mississippiensis TaxID=8496 RepID=A0A151PF34_ALLMI|nr:hypothetical protein Y1Q_0019742 [Alligator mississippiensis]